MNNLKSELKKGRGCYECGADIETVLLITDPEGTFPSKEQPYLNVCAGCIDMAAKDHLSN